MLPGKVYRPEDVLNILRKRFWVVVLPWAIVAAVTAGVARRLPDMYRSQALIQVVPPRVPGSLVQTSTTTRLDERLRAVEQVILSRTRLEGLIREFNLYERERREQILQNVVERMRRDITVLPTKGDTFTVTYVGKNPTTVMKVTERLATYFIDESLKETERRAENTSSFLESQVEEARRKLVDTEQKLTQYQMRYTGELPTQLGSNLQAIQGIQANIQTLVQSINNDVNTKLSLERQVAALEGQADPGSAVVVPVDPNSPGASTAVKLDAARQALAGLQARGMLPTHPTYQRAEKTVQDLEKQLEAESLRAPVGAGGGLSLAEQARQRQLVALKEDIETLKKQIDEKTAEEKRLRSLAASYQAKVDRVPAREAELVEITREYKVQQDIYNNLVANREKANMSVNLERRQIGEQFNLLDQARLPERPFSPDRLLINIFGLAGGLGVGLLIVALLEYRDSTFKTDTELAGLLALPVLAVVPVMQSAEERRTKFRRKVILNVALGGALSVCLAVVAYSFMFIR